LKPSHPLFVGFTGTNNGGSTWQEKCYAAEGAQAGLGVLTGPLVVAMILFATTFLAGG
jgi:hypothetical protein